MDRDRLFAELASLRRATGPDGHRVPHKPLLLLWLLGRLQATGSSACAFEEVDEPVSRLISEYGPPAPRGHGAAMPFVHLEDSLWEVDGDGDLQARRAALMKAHARGRFRSDVEELLRREPALIPQAARFLVDTYFTDSYLQPLCDDVGLDVGLDGGDPWHGRNTRRQRRPGFRREVLHGWRYRCAMCGYDGALGRDPAGLEAAHVRWHSQGGPDELDNGIALCRLHHALLDLGVVGLDERLSIVVSPRFSGRSERSEELVYRLHGRALLDAAPGQPAPAPQHVVWHAREVFKATA